MTAPTGYDLGELLGSEGAPPRRNGELVFEAPWHGRAFGIVMGLAERGHLDMTRFRSELIASINAWERANGPRDEHFEYYDHWIAALETTLASSGTTSSRAIDRIVEHLTVEDDHDH